jgi:hypothetical protein
MPSIFTSNNLVSASKAPEASQVTMLKVVDQNNAFLLVRGYNLQNMPLTARVKSWKEYDTAWMEGPCFGFSLIHSSLLPTLYQSSRPLIECQTKKP